MGEGCEEGEGLRQRERQYLSQRPARGVRAVEVRDVVPLGHAAEMPFDEAPALDGPAGRRLQCEDAGERGSPRRFPDGDPEVPGSLFDDLFCHGGASFSEGSRRRRSRVKISICVAGSSRRQREGRPSGTCARAASCCPSPAPSPPGAGAGREGPLRTLMPCTPGTDDGRLPDALQGGEHGDLDAHAGPFGGRQRREARVLEGARDGSRLDRVRQRVDGSDVADASPQLPAFLQRDEGAAGLPEGPRDGRVDRRRRASEASMVSRAICRSVRASSSVRAKFIAVCAAGCFRHAARCLRHAGA